jgi:hypothetical protein
VVSLQATILCLLVFDKQNCDRFARATGALFLALCFIFVLPEFMGHSNQYDSIAGCLLAIATLTFIIPGLRGKASPPGGPLLGGFLFGCTAFLAVTFWPSLLLLFCAALRRSNVNQVLIGASVALFLNVCFLYVTGSIPGYVADHLYFNLAILGPDMPFSPLAEITVAFIVRPWFALLLLASVLILYYEAVGWNRIRFGLLFVAVSLFFMRGFNFHSLAGLYMGLVLFAWALAHVLAWRGSQIVFLTASVAGLIFVVVAGPALRMKWEAAPLPVESEFSRLAQLITDPQDRIIAYSLQNIEYLLARRLPASGAFFYFKSLADYNASSILGVKIDPCEQIARARPKVMSLDKFNWGGSRPWEAYAGCIDDLVKADYVKVALLPLRFYKEPELDALTAELFIRKDLLANADIFRKGSPVTDARAFDRLVLPLDPAGRGAVRRIGVMLGTAGDRGVGEITIRVAAVGGSQLGETRRVDADGSYLFFSINGENIASADLVAKAGSSVRIRETPGADGAMSPCLIHEYMDGTWSFTKGCPLG